ncbi:MAG: 4-hydroxy-tetrahydrodipicolinate synthase [Clostridia bacterium]|nr:4-hydroxy-tetrahydrodipicolinate synthase [Clostridia bacterium]
MSKSPLFTGCATALVTPFLPDGSLDIPAFRRLIVRQLDAGVDALVLLGTTGEPSTITMDERETIIRIGMEMAAGSIPVIVGTGSNDTRRAIEYAKQARMLGAQGQLCVTPYYNKATQQGLIRHFGAILDACALPMILYNVPSRTGVSISAETAAHLARHPNTAGIKEASGSVAYAAKIQESAGKTLPLYCGNDDAITALMSLGADGAISVCSNIIPMQTRALTHACMSGCFDEARSMQLALFPLIKLLFSQVNPIPAKAALSMMGLCHDVLRLPLTPMEEPQRSELLALLKTMHVAE